MATSEFPITEPDFSKTPIGYRAPDAKCSEWIDIFSSMSTNLATDAMLINQIANYVASASANGITDLARASGLLQLQTDATMIQNDIKMLSSLFTTDVTASSGDILDTSTNVVDRAEAILNTIDRLDSYVDDILQHIDTTVDFVENFPEKIQETIDKFEDTIDKFQESLEELADFDVEKTLEKLPELISDKLLNLDIIKDPLILLNNIQTTVVSITGTLSSIRAPQNLNDVRALLQTLRSLIAQLKAIKAQANKVMESVKRLSDTLQNGNYINVILSLASGGVTFFEKPPVFNPKYPYTHGHSTAGGHRVQWDDAVGQENVSYNHPAGSSIDFQPDGSVVLKSSGDFQLSVSKNLDVSVKGAATITIGGDARIIANTATVEAKTNATITAGAKTFINAVGDVQIAATGSAIMNAGGTCTIAAIGATSVSSSGITTVSGAVGLHFITEGEILTKGNIRNAIISGLDTQTRGAYLGTTTGLHQQFGAPIKLN